MIWSWIFFKKHQQPWLKKLVFTSEWCLLLKSPQKHQNPQMERNESSWRDGWRLFLLVCAKNMRELNEESYLPSKRVGYKGFSNISYSPISSEYFFCKICILSKESLEVVFSSIFKSLIHLTFPYRKFTVWRPLSIVKQLFSNNKPDITYVNQNM